MAADVPLTQSMKDLEELYLPSYEAHYLTKLRAKVRLF